MITLPCNPELLHLTGSLGIHVYGFFVALGLSVFIACTYNHPVRKKYISTTQYDTLLIGSLIAGIVGARLVHVLSEWHHYETFSQMLEVWAGGLSILGAVLGVIFFSTYYLYTHKIPVLPVWDMGALYLPLAQAIARLGCLFTGCCHGIVATGALAVIYTHPASSAPLFTPLVPVQLYSVIWYLVLWGIIQLVAHRSPTTKGQLALLYLIGTCTERFYLDFLRGDRIIDTGASFLNFHYLSMHQWISLLIIVIAAATARTLSVNRRA